MNKGNGIVPGSFRDPSGFLFTEGGVLYRQVNRQYRDNYDALVESGLLEQLTGEGFLVRHDVADIPAPVPETAYLVIRPERVPFISYPYEWSFSQLKDAALATLRVQNAALERGLVLKDASAYNIQFAGGRPVLIDTLSFEAYEEGRPWVAYRQFCQHFLAPLALAALADIRLMQLLRVYIDGVPLDLAAALLPFRSRLRFGLLTHLHLHARSEKHYEVKSVDAMEIRGVTRNALLGLIGSLEKTVTKLRWKAAGTEWAEYYEETNYSSDAMERKKSLVSDYLGRVKPGVVWDLGANTGVFSRIAAEGGALTVSMDNDPACVERNYLDSLECGYGNILPLLVDLANPSPGTGWRNREREPLLSRGPADVALALALVHHLAISNNVPFTKLAGFFSDLCRHLVIEFVPKSDSQVRRLLLSREDVFGEYDREHFEAAFEERFALEAKDEIPGTGRTLYLMRKKEE
ncbi:MAG: SAM-dependent methyltransferase [Actinobacteria bacterium]|nr:SAM-dependent methyltransferase [Actinomycetota bacterium]